MNLISYMYPILILHNLSHAKQHHVVFSQRVGLCSAAAHEKKSLLTMGFIVATPRWDKGGTEEPREIVARRPVLVGPFKFMEEV